MCNHGRFTLLYHRPTQHCKAIFLQLKNRLKKNTSLNSVSHFGKLSNLRGGGWRNPCSQTGQKGSTCEVHVKWASPVGLSP